MAPTETVPAGVARYEVIPSHDLPFTPDGCGVMGCRNTDEVVAVVSGAERRVVCQSHAWSVLTSSAPPW
jgi:hypothetical protein